MATACSEITQFPHYGTSIWRPMPVGKYANDKRQQRSPYDYRRPGTRELQLIPKFVPSLPCFGPLLGPIFFGRAASILAGIWRCQLLAKQVPGMRLSRRPDPQGV